jgi:hypothetical protein
MTHNSKRTGAAIEAHYRFLVWLAPAIEKFPKSRKLTIGDHTPPAAVHESALDPVPVLALAPTGEMTRTLHPTELSAKARPCPKSIDALDLRIAGCG